MLVYLYDEDTDEYAGTGEAQRDPIDESVWVMPAYSTEQKPPIAPKNHVAVYRNGWKVVLDKPTPKKVDHCKAGLEQHIDDVAKSLGCDYIVDCITYADEPEDLELQLRARKLRKWRAACWKKYRQLMNAWKSGGDAQNCDSIIAAMPDINDG